AIPPEEYHLYGDGTRIQIDLAQTPTTMPGGGDDFGGVATPRHDHFFVEIDDIISDDGLRQSIQQYNQIHGCLLPDEHGMVEFPIDFEVNIWKNSLGSSYNASPPVEIQLTLLEYASGQPIDYYFFEPSEFPVPYPAGSTVEFLSDFTITSNPLVSKTIGNEVYYKYFSDPMNPHTLRFSAQSPRVYELLATLVNYPEDGTIPVQTHTQSFSIVVGECECDKIPVSLTMPNPDPLPASGDYARAKTFIEAAGNAGDINILSGNSQTYFGGTEIVLKDGFHAHNGSNFRTLLGDCVDYSSIFREALLEESLSVEVFPNPNQGVFQMEYSLGLDDQFENIQIRIFDAQGRIVQTFSEGAQEKGKLKFNLKDLANGIYWIQLNYGHVQVAKAIHKQ
ncbi:MAG: T9SS type A sorting domain-containing protein, partial [Bacteroidia bacterium]